MLLCQLPRLLGYLLRSHFHASSYEPFWEGVYRTLLSLRDRDALVRRFWSPKRLLRLQANGLANLDAQAVLLSCAPDFLLAPLPGIFLAAEIRSGRFSSMQPGADRLRRVHSYVQNQDIQSYCGAKLADHSLAMEATRSYHQRNAEQIPWEDFVAQEGRRWGWLRHWISPEFFRFWCVGWLNMIAAWLLEVGFGFLLPKNLAFSVGYTFSLLVSYTLNSLITFRRELHLFRLIRYVFSYVPNFLVQFLSLFVLHNLLGWSYLLCCFLAAVIGTPVTFLCLKCFAFRAQHHADSL